MIQKDERPRCAWAGSDPLMVAYHDDEWGRPVHDDRVLFELLTLEGAQARNTICVVTHRVPPRGGSITRSGG